MLKSIVQNHFITVIVIGMVPIAMDPMDTSVAIHLLSFAVIPVCTSVSALAMLSVGVFSITPVQELIKFLHISIIMIALIHWIL